MNEILLQKLKTVKIDKKISKLHTSTITKIISYDNDTKYITCSYDKTIIIQNSEDNTIVRNLTGHKEPVLDIVLLSDGRLAALLWIKHSKYGILLGNCEQTLIGHSDWVYCLLELLNSILLSIVFSFRMMKIY